MQHKILLALGLSSVLVAQAAWAEERVRPDEGMSGRVDETEQSIHPSNHLPSHPSPPSPATTVSEWMAQIEASQVQITGVRVETTDAGLSVVLETLEGELTAPTTRTVGNAVIAEIPNAGLDLPEGEPFEAFGPAEGIALVSVTELPDGSVQVSITGTDAPPAAQVGTEAGNLVLSVVPGAASAVAEDPEAIQVVVTATRTEEELQDVPRSVTVITREEIEQQSNLTTNLTDILGQTVPGFGPPTQRYSNFPQTLRGRNVQVFIDGVPISTNQNTAGATTLRSIAPSAIERIEVVRGPSAAFGEGATGGVINIITRQPEETFTQTLEARINSRGDFAGDSFGTYLEYGISGRSDPFDYVVNASWETFGFAFDGAGDRIPLSNAAPENGRAINLLGKFGVSDETQRLQLSINYFDDTNAIEFINDPDVDSDPQADKARVLGQDFDFIGLDNTGAREYTNLSLNYSHEDVLGSRLNLQGFYRSNFNRFVDPFVFEGTASSGITQDSTRWGGRLDIETSFTETLDVLWGIDYSQEESRQDRQLIDTNDFINSGFQVIRFTEEATQTPPYNVQNFGLFAQAQWNATPTWLLSGGIRYENIGVSVEDYTLTTFLDSPQSIEGGSINADDVVFNIGTVYDLTNELSVFASFAQGFGVPDFGRIFRSPPDGFVSVESDLDFTSPQKVDNYELGFRGQWDNVQFSLAGFFNYSDLGVSLVSQPAQNLRVVRAPRRIYGIEATVDWQPSETWQLGGLISWNEGEDDQDEDGDFEALGTRDIQPIKITAYIENETLPGWRNRLQGLYVGGRSRGFESGADPGEIESYFVLDYISSIELGPGSLQIGIQNLLDEEYFPVSSQLFAPFSLTNRVAAPGRTISIGYRLNF